MRTLTAAPFPSTASLVRELERMLQGGDGAVELATELKPGDAVQLTVGTAKWPAALALRVKVRGVSRTLDVWRTFVAVDDADRERMRAFVGRMQSALTARTASESFPAWRDSK